MYLNVGIFHILQNIKKKILAPEEASLRSHGWNRQSRVAMSWSQTGNDDGYQSPSLFSTANFSKLSLVVGQDWTSEDRLWLRRIETKLFKVRLLIVKLRPFRENKFHPQTSTHFVPGKQAWCESCEAAYWCRRTSCRNTPPCYGAVFLVRECGSCFLIRLHCIVTILSAHYPKNGLRSLFMTLFFFPSCYLTHFSHSTQGSLNCHFTLCLIPET